MKKILLTALSGFIWIAAIAQKTGSVKGLVFDTITKQPVAGATITVLQRSDSSLVTFSMTNNRGEFSLTNLGYGDYRLLVTHVNYHNVNKFFTIKDASRSIDLGLIEVSDKNKVLEEVVVMAEAPPVTLIGDTVQYNAGSFKSKPNAVVEDLLKKMPGIQVEKDGTVKAQGQTVNRVLVDGKEFFGNDPKIATKNLPADAVDKVQVYDKQSDMAQLTGFDDGQSEKTINLKLKKDKKKGVFGKVNAGGGTNERYQTRFNVNSFKGARQMSVIGMGNNTNAEGFSFMDILSFSGGMNQLGGGTGGNININMSSSNALSGAMGGGNNNAINTSWAGGANYNNIIGTKMEAQSNYFFSRYNPVTDQKLSRQYILPDSTYFYNQNSRKNSLSYTHRFNLTYDYLIDSLHSLKFTPTLSLQHAKNNSLSAYETLSAELLRSNYGRSDNYDATDGYNFNGTLLFRKKFKRKGRTFSASLGSTLNNSEGDGELESVNLFYNRQGSLVKTDSINQHSFSESEVRGYNTRAAYTEPLFKRSLLELSVSKSESRSFSDKITYDYNRNSGKHDVVNPLLTNNYENIYGTMTAGIRLRTQKKKYNYSFGLTWQNADLKGTIKSGVKDSVITKTFYNLLPNARFQYNFTRFKNFQLDYRASTNQPSVSQLQPLPDISNPLNIRVGNPGLKQEFMHRINASYTAINPFRNKSLFWFSNYSFTNNRIVNYDLVDSFGRKITTPVNVDGVYNLNNQLSVGLPLRSIKASLNFNTGVGYSKTIQFINTVRNNIYNISIDPRIQISKSFRDKFDLTLSGGFTYNKAKYSLQGSLNNNYLTQDYGIDIGWQLPKNFYLSTDFRYTISSQRSEGFNAKVPLWNAAFSKLFLKYNRGEIKISVYDLLNENESIVRNTNSNYIEDQNNLVLQRFFLLSFTYSLNKMSANAGGGKGNIIIRR
ncbi:MAG TPA: outer membrane beta-barrel family protein [Chitinophagaceae bacterium]|nr:outer membrane beta-barrel family protein [Chitinophagaceae bacterium]